MIESNIGKIWKTNTPRCPKNTFPEVFVLSLVTFNTKMD